MSGAHRRPGPTNLWLVGLAEDLVDLAAGVVDDVDDALLLLGRRGVRRLGDRAEQLADGAAQTHRAGVGAFGDLVPRRRLDLVRGGAAILLSDDGASHDIRIVLG